GGAAVRLLEGHEQGVVGEPARLGLAERPQLGALRGGGALLEAPGGALQQRELGGDQGAVVDALPRQRRQGRQLPRLQPPLGDELLDGDQVVVAGERAERLVGAVAVAGWAQGHHLPQALPGLLEEVEPGDRLAAQLADAVRPRQRGGAEQDARAPGEPHGYLHRGRRAPALTSRTACPTPSGRWSAPRSRRARPSSARTAATAPAWAAAAGPRPAAPRWPGRRRTAAWRRRRPGGATCRRSAPPAR